MKKIIPIVIVGILVLSGLGAVGGTESNEESTISEKIIFSQPNFYEKENYVSLELEEANSNYWIEEKPEMPAFVKVYTFPFGTIIDDVEVTFSDFTEEVISKPINPTPKSYPVSIEAVKNYKPSEEIISYSDLEVYPEKRFDYKTAAGLKGEENVIYLTVTIIPDQYYPQQNIVSHAGKATINIDYTEPLNPVTFGDAYDLLIIAPAQFESALQRLVDHKHNLNPPVSTKLVTLDEIPSGVGVDEQEDIKYYIRDAKENWGITYLLIVGAGVAGQELFPVRYAWLSDDIEDNFPSDLYYADFYNDTGGFSDWDKDGDGRYCEWNDKDHVDVLPDVYLGKLPANNVAEVNHIIDKIIDYKAHNMMVERIFCVGGDTFPGSGQIEGEAANQEVISKLPGYKATKLWATTDTLNKKNIINAWKAGADFGDWSGHGSPTTWATHPENDDETWIPGPYLLSYWNSWSTKDFDLFRINNYKKLPVVFYNSCSNSKFSKNEQTMGWKTLSIDGGGIASFAASGIGYGVPGDETSRRMGWMEVKCFEELYNTKILGDVWGNCITQYHNRFSSSLNFYDLKTLVELAMFGDPTLVIEDGDDPKSASVNVPVFYGLLERIFDLSPTLAKLLTLVIEKLLGI
jgi:hypothetical protein